MSAPHRHRRRVRIRRGAVAHQLTDECGGGQIISWSRNVGDDAWIECEDKIEGRPASSVGSANHLLGGAPRRDERIDGVPIGSRGVIAR